MTNNLGAPPIVNREYRIAASTSASAAQQLSFSGIDTERRVLVGAVGAEIYFNFGASGVSASSTVTSNLLPDDNFSVPDGAIIEVQLKADQTHVSVKTATGSGTAVIKVCE